MVVSVIMLVIVFMLGDGYQLSCLGMIIVIIHRDGYHAGDDFHAQNIQPDNVFLYSTTFGLLRKLTERIIFQFY